MRNVLQHAVLQMVLIMLVGILFQRLPEILMFTSLSGL